MSASLLRLLLQQSEETSRAGGTQGPHRVVTANSLEHHVNVPRLIGEVRRPVVDHLIRAEGSNELVFASAGGAENMGTQDLGDLQRQVAAASPTGFALP